MPLSGSATKPVAPVKAVTTVLKPLAPEEQAVVPAHPLTKEERIAQLMERDRQKQLQDKIAQRNW